MSEHNYFKGTYLYHTLRSHYWFQTMSHLFCETIYSTRRNKSPFWIVRFSLFSSSQDCQVGWQLVNSTKLIFVLLRTLTNFTINFAIAPSVNPLITSFPLKLDILMWNAVLKMLGWSVCVCNNAIQILCLQVLYCFCHYRYTMFKSSMMPPCLHIVMHYLMH